jgi:hypothetical protein
MVQDSSQYVAYYGSYGRLNIFLGEKRGKGRVGVFFFGKLFCRETDPNRC